VNWRTGRGRRAEGLAEGLLLGDERALTDATRLLSLTQKRHHPDEAEPRGDPRSLVIRRRSILSRRLVLDLVVSSTLALDAIHDGEW